MKRVLSLLLLLALTVPAVAQPQLPPFVLGGTPVRKSGTIAAGNTSQTAMAANPGRKMFCIGNPSAQTESLWVDFGEAAVVNTSQEVPPGYTYCFGGAAIYQGIITVIATTISHPYFGFEFQ